MAPAVPPLAPELAKRSSAAATDDLDVVVAAMKASALAGARQFPLQGRNVGILCDDPRRPEVFLIQRAATDLGARVALVGAKLDDFRGASAATSTARVLGRLYDALVCVDVPTSTVEGLREAAGIPVISDVAQRWAVLCATRQDCGDDARYLLQALLISICC